VNPHHVSQYEPGPLPGASSASRTRREYYHPRSASGPRELSAAGVNETWFVIAGGEKYDLFELTDRCMALWENFVAEVPRCG